MKRNCMAFPAVLALVALPGVAGAQTLPPGPISNEDSIVQASAAVLNEIMAVPLSAIPESMLADAEGLAIIPNMIKGSFVVGVRHGRGVLLVRDENSLWHAPVFISMTGGNVGWQAGVQATDVVLVFKTKQSVQGILNGKFTLGADAAAAAGPVGRQASAATDGRLQSEIYSYSRSRGLFAGVSVDGSVIQIDQIANAAYYRRTTAGTVVIPDSAVALVVAVTNYCGAGRNQPAGVPTSSLAQRFAADEAETLRDQLAQTAPQLYELLDQPWISYLALPPEIFTGQGHPSREALEGCMTHFDNVTRGPQYAQLAQRPEFQSTFGLLRHYAATLAQETSKIQLPPPPSDF